jgi:hypothetical protein
VYVVIIEKNSEEKKMSGRRRGKKGRAGNDKANIQSVMELGGREKVTKGRKQHHLIKWIGEEGRVVSPCDAKILILEIVNEYIKDHMDTSLICEDAFTLVMQALQAKGYTHDASAIENFIFVFFNRDEDEADNEGPDLASPRSLLTRTDTASASAYVSTPSPVASDNLEIMQGLLTAWIEQEENREIATNFSRTRRLVLKTLLQYIDETQVLDLDQALVKVKAALAKVDFGYTEEVIVAFVTYFFSLRSKSSKESTIKILESPLNRASLASPRTPAMPAAASHEDTPHPARGAAAAAAVAPLPFSLLNTSSMSALVAPSTHLHPATSPTEETSFGTESPFLISTIAQQQLPVQANLYLDRQYNTAILAADSAALTRYPEIQGQGYNAQREQWTIANTLLSILANHVRSSVETTPARIIHLYTPEFSTTPLIGVYNDLITRLEADKQTLDQALKEANAAAKRSRELKELSTEISGERESLLRGLSAVAIPDAHPMVFSAIASYQEREAEQVKSIFTGSNLQVVNAARAKLKNDFPLFHDDAQWAEEVEQAAVAIALTLLPPLHADERQRVKIYYGAMPIANEIPSFESGTAEHVIEFFDNRYREISRELSVIHRKKFFSIPENRIAAIETLGSESADKKPAFKTYIRAAMQQGAISGDEASHDNIFVVKNLLRQPYYRPLIKNPEAHELAKKMVALECQLNMLQAIGSTDETFAGDCRSCAIEKSKQLEEFRRELDKLLRAAVNRLRLKQIAREIPASTMSTFYDRTQWEIRCWLINSKAQYQDIPLVTKLMKRAFINFYSQVLREKNREEKIRLARIVIWIREYLKDAHDKDNHSANNAFYPDLAEALYPFDLEVDGINARDVTSQKGDKFIAKLNREVMQPSAADKKAFVLHDINERINLLSLDNSEESKAKQTIFADLAAGINAGRITNFSSVIDLEEGLIQRYEAETTKWYLARECCVAIVAAYLEGQSEKIFNNTYISALGELLNGLLYLIAWSVLLGLSDKQYNSTSEKLDTLQKFYLAIAFIFYFAKLADALISLGSVLIKGKDIFRPQQNLNDLLGKPMERVEAMTVSFSKVISEKTNAFISYSDYLIQSLAYSWRGIFFIMLGRTLNAQNYGSGEIMKGVPRSLQNDYQPEISFLLSYVVAQMATQTVAPLVEAAVIGGVNWLKTSAEICAGKLSSCASTLYSKCRHGYQPLPAEENVKNLADISVNKLAILGNA